MTTDTAPSRWRKAKMALATVLAIVLAIICAPFVLLTLLASLSHGRR